MSGAMSVLTLYAFMECLGYMCYLLTAVVFVPDSSTQTENKQLCTWGGNRTQNRAHKVERKMHKKKTNTE